MSTGTDKKKRKEKKKLPPHVEDARDYVTCGPEMNYHTSSFTSAHVFRALGVDNSWDHAEFADGFALHVTRLDDEVMEFELVGVDAALANALRRILIAEVPTVAIEHVFVVDNTSIVQDEVLAHRLGLVPLRIDPRLFESKSAEETPSEKNTVVFKLDVTCTRAPPQLGDGAAEGALLHQRVYTSDLHWLPMGSEMPDETTCRFPQGQAAMFSEDERPRPVLPDILLAKLAPGQRIALEAHCVKGHGKEHAKWSPVATAWYRLLPELDLLQEVPEHQVDELLTLAPGLFVLDESDGVRRVRVTRARDHEQHLEKVRCLLERDEWSPYLRLRKKKDHFLFTVESTGVLPPEVLVEQAVEILMDKCDRVVNTL